MNPIVIILDAKKITTDVGGIPLDQLEIDEITDVFGAPDIDNEPPPT